MKRMIWRLLAIVGLLAFMVQATPMVMAQEEAAAPAAPPAEGLAMEGGDEEVGADGGIGFFAMIAASGIAGIFLWLCLLGVSMAGAWLIIDAFVRVKESKIISEGLVDQVREAMEHGDVMKALSYCDEEPGALANILSAGFSNVEEGFEAIQDSVGISADLESEKLMQRVAYLNLVGNLAPMMGLLGTVQGMIFAFKNLALGGGAGSSLLALNISQALFTTAAGLVIAIPSVGFYYFFKNRATNIILNMEGLTLELIKNLRNVEYVEE